MWSKISSRKGEKNGKTSEEEITKIRDNNNNNNNNNNNKVEGKGGKGVAHSTRHLRIGIDGYSRIP